MLSAHLREIEEKYQQQLEDSEALTEQNKSLDSSVAQQQVQQRDRQIENIKRQHAGLKKALNGVQQENEQLEELVQTLQEALQEAKAAAGVTMTSRPTGDGEVQEPKKSEILETMHEVRRLMVAQVTEHGMRAATVNEFRQFQKSEPGTKTGVVCSTQ